ncbi:hypothetical protein ACYULU_05800 [Breznakiellaceae bacterium SP9]
MAQEVYSGITQEQYEQARLMKAAVFQENTPSSTCCFRKYPCS